MHNHVGFQHVGSLTEGILQAPPAAGIAIMAYGKITKVGNGIEKSNFQKKYFSLLLWVTKRLVYQKKRMKSTVICYSVGLQALLNRSLRWISFFLSQSNWGITHSNRLKYFF